MFKIISSSTRRKACIKHPTDTTHNGDRLNIFPPKIRNETKMSAFTTAVQHYTLNSSQSN